MPSKKKATPKTTKKPVFKSVYVSMRLSVEESVANMDDMLHILNLSDVSGINVEQLSVDICG